MANSTIKPWEGNGGTIYINSSTKLPSNMNISGSSADKAAVNAAQVGVATDIFQKSFFDRGQNYGFSSAAQMASAYVNPSSAALTDKIAAVAASSGTFAPAAGLAKFPDDNTSSGSSMNWLLIGAVALGAFMLLRKK